MFWEDEDFAPPVGAGKSAAGPFGRIEPGLGAGVTAAKATDDPAIPHLTLGDKVTHDKFGLGTVVALEGSGRNVVAKVDFGAGDAKRLLLRMAPLTKL